MDVSKTRLWFREMSRYFLRRLALSIPAIFGVLLIVFLLIHLIPGDPVDLILGDSALPSDRYHLRVLLGLNLPLAQQFWAFLKNLADGSWGQSFVHNRSVLGLILERFPATAILAMASMVVALGVSIPLGTFAALRRGRVGDT